MWSADEGMCWESCWWEHWGTAGWPGWSWPSVQASAQGWFEPCSPWDGPCCQPGPLAGDGAVPWWSSQAPSPPALITPRWPNAREYCDGEGGGELCEGSQWDPSAVDTYSAVPPLEESLQLPAHCTLHWTGVFAVWRWRATASLACWKLSLQRFGTLPFSAVGCGALTSLSSFSRSTHYCPVEATTW